MELHLDRKARSGLLKMMSDEVGWVRFEKGLRVGSLGLFITVILPSWFRRRSPLWSSCWVRSHDGSWALKSPAMIVLFAAARLPIFGW